ncbi:AbrB/MazE/SpoVT family DNA-binding domain-containing protein [Allopusillimonas ginsengisoli]|uniref:AbrB/MazE/SpoVT family DNA-binding domain-containing protein n=1 Tax=Allopusillimonas ginsengisoli TaxID=453575 RepID=UPI0039C10D13
METTLRKFGNSIGLVIPKALRESLGLVEGQSMTIEQSGDGFILRQAKRRYTLDELLAQCDPAAPMPAALAEWDDAPVIGGEKW